LLAAYRAKEASEKEEETKESALEKKKEVDDELAGMKEKVRTNKIEIEKRNIGKGGGEIKKEVVDELAGMKKRVMTNKTELEGNEYCNRKERRKRRSR